MSYSNDLGPKYIKANEGIWLEKIAKSCRTYHHYRTFTNLLKLWVSKYKDDKYGLMWVEYKVEKLDNLAFRSREDIPNSMKL